MASPGFLNLGQNLFATARQNRGLATSLFSQRRQLIDNAITRKLAEEQAKSQAATAARRSMQQSNLQTGISLAAGGIGGAIGAPGAGFSAIQGAGLGVANAASGGGLSQLGNFMEFINKGNFQGFAPSGGSGSGPTPQSRSVFGQSLNDVSNFRLVGP